MPSETPPLQLIKPGYRLQILTDEELERFKSATLEDAQQAELKRILRSAEEELG